MASGQAYLDHGKTLDLEATKNGPFQTLSRMGQFVFPAMARIGDDIGTVHNLRRCARTLSVTLSTRMIERTPSSVSNEKVGALQDIITAGK